MAKWPKTNEKQLTTFGQLTRSELMSRVKSSGNKTTELKLLDLLCGSRINGWQRNASLTGKPDFVWPEYKLAVFVDGCFWHGHNCGKKLTSQSNTYEWELKLRKTKKRDRKVTTELRKKGWSVIRIWECHLRKNPKHIVARIKRIITLRKNLANRG